MSNVFGVAITNATLEAMAEYAGKTITATDRAHVALNMRSANGKDTNARTYVENLKKQWGNGVSTLCMFYNATGGSLSFLNETDWNGQIGPSPYPTRLENGQWGAFLHTKKPWIAKGSEAAVIYRGKNAKTGLDCDCVMAWGTPWSGPNSCWTETRGAGHFNSSILEYLYTKVDDVGRNGYTDRWEGTLSTISIGGGTSPVCEALFTSDAAFALIAELDSRAALASEATS